MRIQIMEKGSVVTPVAVFGFSVARNGGLKRSVMMLGT
jgi:hypothetical protein